MRIITTILLGIFALSAMAQSNLKEDNSNLNKFVAVNYTQILDVNLQNNVPSVSYPIVCKVIPAGPVPAQLKIATSVDYQAAPGTSKPGVYSISKDTIFVFIGQSRLSNFVNFHLLFINERPSSALIVGCSVKNP